MYSVFFLTLILKCGHCTIAGIVMFLVRGLTVTTLNDKFRSVQTSNYQMNDVLGKSPPKYLIIRL